MLVVVVVVVVVVVAAAVGGGGNAGDAGVQEIHARHRREEMPQMKGGKPRHVLSTMTNTHTFALQSLTVAALTRQDAN